MLCSIYSSMLEMGIMSLQLPDVTIHKLETKMGMSIDIRTTQLKHKKQYFAQTLMKCCPQIEIGV